jgi:hypothetical protein
MMRHCVRVVELLHVRADAGVRCVCFAAFTRPLTRHEHIDLTPTHAHTTHALRAQGSARKLSRHARHTHAHTRVLPRPPGAAPPLERRDGNGSRDTYARWWRWRHRGVCRRASTPRGVFHGAGRSRRDDNRVSPFGRPEPKQALPKTNAEKATGTPPIVTRFRVRQHRRGSSPTAVTTGFIPLSVSGYVLVV